MSLPTNRVKKVTASNGIVYDIVPEMLQKSGYSAELPTLTSNSTISLTNVAQTISGTKTFTVNQVAGSTTNRNVSIYDYGTETQRGVDASSSYLGCFLVGYINNLNTYSTASARIIVQDMDTVGRNLELWVDAYFGLSGSTKTYAGNIGVVNSTGGDPVALSKNNFFLVMRTTDTATKDGVNRVELWYKQTETYQRYKFTFMYDDAWARTPNIVKWGKFYKTSGEDQAYVSANKVVYSDSGNLFPIFIPTGSWGTSVFTDGTTYKNSVIYSNTISPFYRASCFRAYASTPNIEGYMSGDLHSTTPASVQGTQFLARDQVGNWMGGLRYYHTTGDKSQTQLIARSPKTSTYSSGVMLEQDASATGNNQADKCRFIPFGNGTMDLGTSNNKWRNIYGTTIYESGTSLASKYVTVNGANMSTTQWTQPTRNYTGVTDYAGVGYSKYGKLVRLHVGDMLCTSDINSQGGDLKLFSGLPKPSLSYTFPCEAMPSAGWGEHHDVIRLQLKADGCLYLHYSIMYPNNQYGGDLVYIEA